jgi:hypothetical protein
MAASPDPSDHDDFDDLLLDAAAELAAGLADVPDAELAGRARELVQLTLITRRPDGTWPPGELLDEILTMYLDAVDGRLPRGEATWLDAWREAVENPELLARMLEELRATQDEAERDAKVPRYPPPDELRVVDP